MFIPFYEPLFNVYTLLWASLRCLYSSTGLSSMFILFYGPLFNVYTLLWASLQCSYSSMGLSSMFTFIVHRFMNAERSATHKNLTVALFFAQLLFLFGIDKTSNLVSPYILSLFACFDRKMQIAP